MSKRWLIAGASALALMAPAHAQNYRDSNGTVSQEVVPLIGCSSNGNCAGPISASNPMPISGSISTNISPFMPGGVYATLAASAASSRAALPAGAVVVIYNTGASAAYVQLGGASVSATTSAADVVQPGSWLAFTVGSNTYLAAITASGATTLNLSGGVGLPNGSGGALGASSGGAVSQGTAAAAGSAWPVYPTVGGAAVSAGNALPVSATGLPLPAGAATAANQPTSAAAGSATSGQTGNLEFAAVTTSAPSYATGTSNFLSLNTSGGLRVDGSGVTQPVSAVALPLPSGAATAANQTSVMGSVAAGAAAANSVAMGCVYNSSLPTLASGQQAGEQCDSSGRQLVNVATLPALPAGASTIGSVNINGNSGALTQTSVTVGASSTAVLAASSAANFIKLCVAQTAASGVWVRWDGGTATQAAPAEYMPPGQCNSWVKSTGYLPTSAINAIAPTSVAVSLIYN